MATDYDYLTAVVRYLMTDDTLKSLIGDNIYVDFPEEDIKNGLNNTKKTLLSVSMPDVTGRGSFGSATHRIQEENAIIQVDVMSQYGGNAKYCKDVATRVKDVIFTDIDITLSGVRYGIYITKADIHTFHDDEIDAWHCVVSADVEYWRVAPT